MSYLVFTNINHFISNIVLFIKGLSTGNDIAIIVLQTPASLTENVQIANLPAPDASCRGLGNNLIVSGWGKSIIWDDPNEVRIRENRFLWAVKQECLDITECDVYKGDEKDALCIGDLSESRNSAYHGDSGGKHRLKINNI